MINGIKVIMPKDARRCIVEDYVRLLSLGIDSMTMRPESVTDLVEMARYTWLDGAVNDSRGVPVSFIELVRLGCLKTGMHPPKNISSIAHRASMRKGVKCNNVIERRIRLYKMGIKEENKGGILQ